MQSLRSFIHGFAFLALLYPIVATATGEEALPFTPKSETSVASMRREPFVVLTAGTGLAIYSGEYAKLYDSGSFGYTANAGALWQISDSAFYTGIDFGLDFWGFSSMNTPGGEVSRSALGIQVLPTLVYRFDGIEGGVIPYIGFSLGPNIYVLKQRQTNPGANSVTTSTDTRVYFEVLARPGVDFRLGGDRVAINFEPKFGILNTDFIFLPQLNLRFSM